MKMTTHQKQSTDSLPSPSSGDEDKAEETGTSVKENIKSKVLQAKNIQEIWGTIKGQIYK